MISKSELIDWLETLEDEDLVYIDKEILCSLDDLDAFIEIGKNDVYFDPNE